MEYWECHLHRARTSVVPW